MLRTFVALFDFDYPNGGRTHFTKLASKLGERFDALPQIVDKPLFSYGKNGRTQLEQLRMLDVSRPAIVYLSSISMHSSLLTIGDFDASDLVLPLCYDSVESFIKSPVVRGFRVPDNLAAKTTLDDTAVMISDLARFRDDEDQLPDDGIFRVLDHYDDVYVCKVLDFDRYFQHAAIFGDQPFFLPADVNVDFRECIRQLNKYSLREYLLKRSISFATLGDDHQDDEFAVSYAMDCWQLSGSELMFVR
ncbi:hypothetical protein C5Y96_14440 [Blastopirellula marina]|uniref:Uncharacterized protein n=1 Tax=Blastopirellula marina TaxID=124 RepID=A0A2S8FEZ8_9BACT|nr:MULTISPECIES: hypothetical protein [Pirellulaceae]PQO30660.1 hypothetical protein C5Y96_14440 [Blastopirellula marina]RCS50797.1 hypothetical protein DTL36_14450 [Bremerella cremea]